MVLNTFEAMMVSAVIATVTIHHLGHRTSVVTLIGLFLGTIIADPQILTLEITVVMAAIIRFAAIGFGYGFGRMIWERFFRKP